MLALSFKGSLRMEFEVMSSTGERAVQNKHSLSL